MTRDKDNGCSTGPGGGAGKAERDGMGGGHPVRGSDAVYTKKNGQSKIRQ